MGVEQAYKSLPFGAIYKKNRAVQQPSTSTDIAIAVCVESMTIISFGFFVKGNTFHGV